AIASALGGLCRYLLGGWLARSGSAFPWETLAINVSGTFALGFLFTLFVDAVAAPPWLRSAVLIGFLGSCTTFSTFSLESFGLIEDGAHWLAVANLIGSLVAGLIAVYAGIVLARAVA
ncbi:MAG: fluoride efflux transporter CrcB, partial [Gemmatimonas sp.]|nr:fluoride efflux transporter CrcB [Gemmatimonas sp.]